MRGALLLFTFLALGAGAGCSRSGACASTSLDPATDLPRSPATTTSGTTPHAIDVRFAAVATSGATSQVFLLTTASATDGTGHTVTTVEAVRDYAGGVTANAWLDQRSHWRAMRGLGIGSAPILPQAPAEGAFVAIAGATSVVRFPLYGEESVDAGPAPADAGTAPPHAREWEWPWPAAAEVPDSGAQLSGPLLSDLLVIPRWAPDHDLALVARTTNVVGGISSGGELFVLDLDDPAHVISLGEITFDRYADAGLAAHAAAFAADAGVVYVALDHQTFGSMPTYGAGLVAVLDPGMRSVRSVIRLPSLTNCTRIAPYHPPTRATSDPADPGESHRVVVTCLGTTPTTPGATPSDAGWAYLELDPAHPSTLPTLARTILASSLGTPRPDGGIMPLYGHWLAFVSQGSPMPASPDRLFVVNLDTGDTQLLRTATTAGLATAGLGPGAFDPGSGVLVVPNGLDGVLTWQVPADYATLESGHYAFADAREVATSVEGCGRQSVRLVRAIGGGSASVTPVPDAGMPDMGTLPSDMGTPSMDAGVDAASAPDAGRDAAPTSTDAGRDSGG